MTRPPEIDLVHKTITSDNSGNEGIDSQPHVTINSADFMVCDVQKNSRVMRRYLLSIFRSHIPSLPNAHVEAENNNNATQQPKKKQNYLHPFTGIRNQNNHDLSQAEPRYKTPS
jgi:hypothetical protein